MVLIDRIRRWIGWPREEAYKCRCGKTHRGDYAIYDYGHHMCFHDTELHFLGKQGDLERDVMCSDCGEVWQVEEARGEHVR